MFTKIQKLKILTDILLTAALLFLMPYEMIGDGLHEWIGVGMFLLFILHHILNRPYDLRLLGLCADVLTSGNPLERDDGDGGENTSGIIPSAAPDCADGRSGDCSLWIVCFYQKRYWKLYADAGSFCILRLFRTGNLLSL